jgi:hypothetical protein
MVFLSTPLQCRAVFHSDAYDVQSGAEIVKLAGVVTELKVLFSDIL